jgi:hypothetical protein
MPRIQRWLDAKLVASCGNGWPRWPNQVGGRDDCCPSCGGAEPQLSHCSATRRISRQTEVARHVLDHWAYERDVHLDFIDSGKPAQNAFVESFNGKFRDSVSTSNGSWILMTHSGPSRRTVRTYYSYWPRSSPGGLTPEEFEALTSLQNSDSSWRSEGGRS